MDERDIVERLRAPPMILNPVGGVSGRALPIFPNGPSYSDMLYNEAAAEIERLRLDLTRAREEAKSAATLAGVITVKHNQAISVISTTQAELAKLRARVVEVGGPFASYMQPGKYYHDPMLTEHGRVITMGDFRALSSLVKEVESGT